MKSSIKNISNFLRKNTIELAFLCLLVFSFITFFQVDIIRIVRTFGVSKQEIKLDDISSIGKPLNVDNISSRDRAYLQINLEFRVDGTTGHPNLFQTDVANSGIRAELNGSTIALLFPSANEKSKTKALILTDKLNVGHWYSFSLEALNGSFITSDFSGSKTSHSESENPEFGASNIRVGIGFDDVRRFHGEIRNVVITQAVARAPWIGILILYTIKIFLLFLIVFCLYCVHKDALLTQSKLPRVTLIHFLCQIPGIFYLANKDDVALRQFFDLGEPFYAVIPWRMPPAPPALENLIVYALLLMIVGSITLTPFPYNSWRERLASPGCKLLGGLVAYEVISMALPLAMGNLAGLWFWLAVVGLLPAYIFFNQRKIIGPMAERTILAIYLVLLGGVGSSLLSTSWNPSLRFLNDYADLPEYTVLKNDQQVENRKYLREHAIQGEYSYDPCEPAVDGVCLNLPRRIFTNERVPFNIFPPGKGLIYDWDKEVLKAYRPLTNEDVKIINMLWGITLSPGHLDIQNNSNASRFSPDVNEFFFKNRMELGAQASLGRFIYHHAFLYLPALETAMSLPTNITPMQYGKGLTNTLGVLLRIGGTPNFQTYYKIYWMGIITYLILLGAIAWSITRNQWIGIAASTTGIVLLMSVAPDALRMAPGFNPVRHLPDLFCLIIIAVDSRRNSYRFALLRAIAISLFLWWNKEFGIFMLLGSMVWHFFETVGGYRDWRAGLGRIAIECFLGGGILVLSGNGENNGLAFYNLMGIGTPQTRWRDVIFWLAIWIPAISAIVWGRFFLPSDLSEESVTRRSLLDVSGVGIIYAGFTTIYAIWNPSPNHYAVVGLCAVLPFATMFAWIHLRLSATHVSISWLPRYVAASTIVMVLMFSYHDKLEFLEYDQVFKEHRLFEWHFMGLAGLTTADPKLLVESTELVQKYQPQGRILLISRYDTLMQTILNRPGILPYIDIPSTVVSWGMIDNVAARINESKPTYIFADRDLQVDKEWAVANFSSDKSVASPQSQRVGSLAALAQVIRVVGPCYVPGEVQGMLQVWHRTCT